MKSTDRLILPHGALEISLIDKQSLKVVHQHKDSNILVLDAETAITKAIAGNSEGFITTLKLGTDVGSGTEESPEAPSSTYDETTMLTPFTVPSNLIIGYSNSLTVAFSVTVDGMDVVTELGDGSQTSIKITSAALHTKNGKVFSYKRFPRISISGALSISFVWTIGF